MQATRKLRACAWSERWLLAWATVALAIFRFAVVAVPFRFIARSIGLRTGRSPEVIADASRERAARIGHAVRSAAAHAPWESTCLVQALAAAALLRCSGIQATLYLGVAKDAHEATGLTAHAWLHCGGSVLTGEFGLDRFAELTSFRIG